jgi:hypothetical protein
MQRLILAVQGLEKWAAHRSRSEVQLEAIAESLIRLCLGKGVFTEGEFQSMVQEIYKETAERLSGAIPGEALPAKEATEDIQEDEELVETQPSEEDEEEDA